MKAKNHKSNLKQINLYQKLKSFLFNVNTNERQRKKNYGSKLIHLNNHKNKNAK